METDYEEGRVVIRLSGDVDLVTVPRLEPRIERAIAGALDVVVDLTEVQFLDSGGLRLLTRVSSTAAANNQALVVVAPPNSIARSVLDIAGMKGGLVVHDSPRITSGARIE
jgi:anti-sigma B factor antagonist